MSDPKRFETKPTTKKQKIGFAALGLVGALVLGIIGYQLVFAPVPEAEVNCDPKPSVRTDASVEVAVVAAPTKTFQDIDLPLAIAAERIKPLLSDSSKINTLSVVVANDNPRKVRDLVVELEPGDVAQDFQEKLDRATSVVRLGVSCTLDAQSGQVTVESDLLKALGTASASFLNEGSKKTIFVLSNGLQTTGEIDMASNMPQSDAQAISLARQLQKSNALPDLRGAKVEWFGIGSVRETDTQPKINEQTIKVLETFWTEIVHLSGGELTYSVREVGTAAPPENSFETSGVKSLPASCLITLTENDGVRFNADQTSFVNLDKAKAAAADVVKELNQKKCTGQITVTGYVASGVDEPDYDQQEIASGKSLSLARAKAFGELIKAAGWTGKIVSVGGGKGPSIDWNSDGTFNETKGKDNRKVVISQ